ncbi:MAG: site-specific DNA-methyltransferase [Terriglobales bacterium]
MTELIWEGKYVDGKRQSPVRVALPFQTIETVNEGTADRQRSLELFTAGRETEWRNRLIWGDKKYVLPSLLPEFAGKVDLIYIDPPFDTGADFSFTAKLPSRHPDSDDDAVEFIKEPSIIEQKAYRDTWGRGLDSYVEWFYETVSLLRELLSPAGSLYVHLDWHVGHYAKTVLDEVFGQGNFRNEIVWKRKGGSANPQNRLGVVTDSILWFSNSESIIFNPQFTKDSEDSKKYLDERFNRVDEKTGRRFMDSPLVSPNPRPNLTYAYKGYAPPPSGWSISREVMERWDKEGRLLFPPDKSKRIRRKIFLDEYVGQPVQNLWNDIFVINSQSNEFVGYDTQKPEALLERIIKLSSNEDNLVLDCFCGSGTTAAVAEKFNRRWIACDLGRFATHTTRKRLLSIPRVRPFAVQNLGKYERQAWQTAEFRDSGGESNLEQQRQREAAYRKFILDLYHASPVTGHTWLHGMKAGRMVHVGAVDAPVTLSDVKSIARDVWKSSGGTGGRRAAADILGWEFAFELNETARQVAAESRVEVSFRKIPREVLEKKAVDQGDIKFFELGALSVELKQTKNVLTLKLTDFLIPIDDVPEEARQAVKHWSQIIDYWAVDWDFKGDTFHNQWQSYRTRNTPNLELSTRHECPNPGDYKIVVKVIDILGNDTTKTLDIKVK